MRQAKNLESSGQTLGEPSLDKQRSRAEQHYLDRPLCARVFVPKSFDGLGPSYRFLHLIEDEDCAFSTGRKARCFPLLRDPLSAAQGGLIGTGETDRKRDVLDDLLN